MDRFGERGSADEAAGVAAGYEQLAARRAGVPEAWLALATHDAAPRERLLLPGARCELLLGVRPETAVTLAGTGRDVRIDVPYGPQWFRSLMRRRAESMGPEITNARRERRAFGGARVALEAS